MTKFKLRKNDKNNLRISAKPYAHFQTLTETPGKFKKDPAKIVGGVASFLYRDLYVLGDDALIC